ncbi:hypothetical protein L596_020360 [Steinernema carpocapsae]|uniref:Uncharacterized protein n=1 Tax=Steinernema carpocapsae TaxID=34508 RepID=A0A4U5MTA5_STECR|nr:hypothetical protein L596_020360 [Steinernema carpocapsae]
MCCPIPLPPLQTCDVFRQIKKCLQLKILQLKCSPTALSDLISDPLDRSAQSYYPSFIVQIMCNRSQSRSFKTSPTAFVIQLFYFRPLKDFHIRPNGHPQKLCQSCGRAFHNSPH